MSNNITNDVDFRGLGYTEMSQHWSLVRTLLGGTHAMRRAGTEFLPKYPAEQDGDYAVRLERAVLTNYYGMTVKHLVGKAFAKPLVLKEDVPPQILEWCEDIDLQGTHFNDFSAEVFREALGVGMSAIYVDFPKQEAGYTLADERKLGSRPYMSIVNVESILGVRTTGRANEIELARILEESTEADGLYGERTARRIRVLYPSFYQLFEATEKGDWIMVDEGVMKPLKQVPLVPIYGQKVRSWVGRPPLLDLAYKNVQHYQTDSDHENALHVASFPILAVAGWEADKDPRITIGPNQVLATADPNGRFYYVEHSGSALNAGRQRIEDLKADMATMGIQMLMPQASGNVTATETQVKYAEATSDLQRMAFNLKDGLENALVFMANWIGLPDGGSVELRGQFVLPRDASVEAQALLAMRTSGEITSTTFLTELIRRDFLPDDFDVEAEQAILAIQGPDGYEFS